MKNHDGDIKGYYWLSKSWYGDVNLKGMKYVDEINLGFYCEDGGTSGEFCAKWYMLNGEKPSLKIEVFEDSFHAFWECKDLIKELSTKDSKEIQPQEFVDILNKLGYKDLTHYEQ